MLTDIRPTPYRRLRCVPRRPATTTMTATTRLLLPPLRPPATRTMTSPHRSWKGNYVGLCIYIRCRKLLAQPSILCGTVEQVSESSHPTHFPREIWGFSPCTRASEFSSRSPSWHSQSLARRTTIPLTTQSRR